MMIHLAKEAERKSKLAKDKGPKNVAQIQFSEKWINWIIVALIAFQVFLNLAAYNAALSGMNNMSLFLAGLILIVFAGMFHVYRYAMAKTKEAPPPPGPKIKMRKSITSSDSKELPSPDSTSIDDGSTKPISKTTNETTPSQIPEIKPNTAELDANKDQNLGIDDLKKP